MIEVLLIIESIIVPSLIKSDLKFMTQLKFVEFVQRPTLVARCKVQKVTMTLTSANSNLYSH